MEAGDEGNSSMGTRVSCSCKSTCSTKRTRGTNRGCPCKAEGLSCGDQCSCGTTAKPCKNKPDGVNPAVPPQPRPRAAQPYRTETNRPNEEEERIKENNDVKNFILHTLDEPMVRKLCIRSLRRGVGSMDYIQGLLIAEDDLDEEQNTSVEQTIQQEQPTTPVAHPAPEPGPSSGGASGPPWCKCGICVSMPQEIENKCCGLRRCVTGHTRFQKLCLDPDVLQLTIRNRGDIRNDREDNSTRSFRKAGYRQFVLDRYGYLGKGNRKVCPSCVVKAIRRHYPSPTGVYMGYRHE